MIKDYVLPFFAAVARHDLFGECFWHEDFSLLAVVSNDVFFWGCADLEEVGSLQDVELLDKSCEEAGIIDGPILYCARKRGMRPQGAMYKHFEEKNRVLFDACGPEREINLFNPNSESGEYLYKEKQ